MAGSGAPADHALSQSLGRPTLACLATAINKDRNAYYHALEKAGKGEINLHGFLDYFTGAVNRAQAIARAEVAFILDHCCPINFQENTRAA